MIMKKAKSIVAGITQYDMFKDTSQIIGVIEALTTKK